VPGVEGVQVGFYRWKAAEPARAQRAAEDERLAARIRYIHTESGKTYGAPRVTAELRDAGEVVNRKRVARIMRSRGVIGRHLRRRSRTTVPDPAAPPVPDLLRRDFAVGAPDVQWCGDIAYLPVGGQWMYLATVIDIGTRRLLGYSIADHMHADLVVDALNAAVRARGGQVAGVIFHSDHGAQLRFKASADACAAAAVRQSMGAVGSSADNTLAESFFASLKREILPKRGWPSHRQARLEVFRWLTFYNTRRRHSALGQLSPIAYERRSTMLAAAA
jgi:transposase InsO family protein